MRKPRFSLLNALLLTAIVAMAMGLWRQHTELGPLREEVGEHRDTLGIFKVEEPKKIHAIRLRKEERYSTEPLLYQFRVYLPEGKRYLFSHAAFKIPAQGMPDPKPRPYAHNVLAPGESLITVLIERRIDQKTGEPQPSINVTVNIESAARDSRPMSSTGTSLGIGEAQNDWIVNKTTDAMCFTQDMIGRKLELFDSEEPVVLLRIRAGKIKNYRARNGGGRSWQTEQLAEPCDGFMFWIEPEKK